MEAKFNDLLGKTLTDVQVHTGPCDDDEIIFICSDGDIFRMYHRFECCENVGIEDISGNIKTLIGNPVLYAEVSTSDACVNSKCGSADYSYTWTFYKLATIVGWVDIRWFGTSSGYYSEEVNFEKVGAA